MLGRKLRTRLDLLNPKRSMQIDLSKIKTTIEKQQENQKQNYKSKIRKTFKINEIVMVKDYCKANKIVWTKARIVKRLGMQIYLVQVIESKKMWKRHLNQIISACEKKNDNYYIPTTLNDKHDNACINKTKPIEPILEHMAEPNLEEGNVDRETESISVEVVNIPEVIDQNLNVNSGGASENVIKKQYNLRSRKNSV